MEIGDPLLVLADGLVVTRAAAARLDHGGAFDWLTALRKTPTLAVPETARLELLDALSRSHRHSPTLPRSFASRWSRGRRALACVSRPIPRDPIACSLT